MKPKLTSPTVAQMVFPVKPPINSQLPLFADSMIHHNEPSLPSRIIVSYSLIRRGNPYGVSRSYRVLSSQLLLKKFDRVRECLANSLGLTTAQREVALRLLRLWAYYGQVYPKEAQITGEPGCSKATYWRTIRILRELNLIKVVHRYVLRPHAQISNLYRLDRLVVVLARYLSEHGVGFYESWLQPILKMPGHLFWSMVYQTPGARAGPGAPAQ